MKQKVIDIFWNVVVPPLAILSIVAIGIMMIKLKKDVNNEHNTQTANMPMV